ncbi:MAG TPA: hypothetical protein VGJ92_13755, partial [Methanocella sp.]
MTLSGTVKGTAIAVLVACIAIIFIASAADASTSSVIYVPQDYAHIQDAINEAHEGDTIVVASGVYNEYLDIGTAGITIVGGGATRPVIDGTGLDEDG